MRMTNRLDQENSLEVATLEDLSKLANYSLMDTLNCDPDAKVNGADHKSRQVFSGHYVPVNPTPLKDPEYVTHSKFFFHELGFADDLAQSLDFVRMFSGDISQVPEPMRKVGWACGYALSIYGTEYIQQCPFQTGNGYGDGRAVSILEAAFAYCASLLSVMHAYASCSFELSEHVFRLGSRLPPSLRCPMFLSTIGRADAASKLRQPTDYPN